MRGPGLKRRTADSGNMAAERGRPAAGRPPQVAWDRVPGAFVDGRCGVVAVRAVAGGIRTRLSRLGMHGGGTTPNRVSMWGRRA